MKVFNIILLVLLVAAILLGLFAYQRYVDKRNAFLSSVIEQRALKEKVTQLSKENASLGEQIQKKAKELAEYRDAENVISKLKEAMDLKKKELTLCEERIKSESEAREKTIEGLRAELSSKESSITEMRGKLETAASQIASLKEEAAKTQKEIKELERAIADVRDQKEQLQGEIDRMRSTHDAMVSEFKKEIGNKEVTISQLQEKLSIELVNRVLFRLGEAAITPQGKEILKKVGAALKKVKTKMIRVIGHTDDTPISPEQQFRFPSNWELSTARAAAVVRYFQNTAGLDPKNMEAVGRSFYDPVATNETEEGRSQNRRVSITVAPRLK